MENKITKEKLEKYYNTTRKALDIAKKKVNKNKKEEAEEIIKMVENYLSDSKHFKDRKDYVNSFACINYSHGWLDSGARLGIFKVKNTDLFVIK
jgi:hypothetical protein